MREDSIHLDLVAGENVLQHQVGPSKDQVVAFTSRSLLTFLLPFKMDSLFHF